MKQYLVLTVVVMIAVTIAANYMAKSIENTFNNATATFDKPR